jgi:hypothetical protein
MMNALPRQLVSGAALGHVGATVPTGELRLLLPLLSKLQQRGTIRRGSYVCAELPLNGRRVDFATLSVTGITHAFELKLGGFSRVLEQAIYNRNSFDWSWIVIPGVPNPSNADLCREYGIGIIRVQHNVNVALAARRNETDPSVARRLHMKMKSIGTIWDA